MSVTISNTLEKQSTPTFGSYAADAKVTVTIESTHAGDTDVHNSTNTM